jgi:hypothetical protein
MSEQTVIPPEPHLPSARTLILVAFCSTLVIGVVDWLTNPHDVVIRKLTVIDGELVETSSSSRPSPLRGRLGLTILTGVVGGVLTAVATWCGFRMRLSRWRIRHGSASTILH